MLYFHKIITYVYKYHFVTSSLQNSITNGCGFSFLLRIRYPPYGAKNFGWLRWLMARKDPADNTFSYIPLLLLGLLCALLMKVSMALPCPAPPCPALPRPVPPCPALPCPALPCPALPCPVPPCPALPCPALRSEGRFSLCSGF